jgi:hypothetical protein
MVKFAPISSALTTSASWLNAVEGFFATLAKRRLKRGLFRSVADLQATIQGYNAQAAVDRAKQIIVAHGLTQSMSDCPQLVPLVDAVRANLGRKPREISADAGYCSEDNLLALATRKIHAYVATGRAKPPAETARKIGGEMTQKMRQKLKRAGYRNRHRLRKQIVEPVFGQIKQARGFRKFLLRGLEAVQAEWR